MLDAQEIALSFERQAKRAEFARGILSEKTRRQALRAFYRLAVQEIFEEGSREWGIDPYEVDWMSVFTPIERALWHDIRAANVVMYPQFPVLGYFVDFANPVSKVCIECDGAKWHTDAAADAKRENAIRIEGWRMYRITGRDCKTESDTETGERSAARVFIDRLAQSYPISRNGGDYAR